MTRISDVIERLIILQEKFGDVEVETWDAFKRETVPLEIDYDYECNKVFIEAKVY